MFCSHLSTPACTECVAQTLTTIWPPWRRLSQIKCTETKKELFCWEFANSGSKHLWAGDCKLVCEQLAFYNCWNMFNKVRTLYAGQSLSSSSDLFYAFSICALTLVFIALIVGGCNTHNFYLSSYFYFLFILFYWQFAENRYLFSLLFGFWKL